MHTAAQKVAKHAGKVRVGLGFPDIVAAASHHAADTA
jgi:hypothetical protein